MARAGALSEQALYLAAYRAGSAARCAVSHKFILKYRSGVTSPIYLIMGTPAAGKSTVARALMGRFTHGLHIPVDDVRHMVVSGLADMGPERYSDEVTRQLLLAHEAAARIAQTYGQAGFAVALDDFWFGDAPGADYVRILGPELHRVILRPSRTTALERLAARGAGSESFRGMLAMGIAEVDDALERHPKVGWRTIDSSDLSVEETVDRILHETQTTPA